MMGKAKRIAIIFSLFVAAVISYMLGSASGMVVFLMLGVVLELAMWVRIFSGKPPKTH